MESNKSKVEETMITGIIAKHMGYANQTSVVNAAHEVLEYVKSLTSLAHPQQSEGVGLQEDLAYTLLRHIPSGNIDEPTFECVRVVTDYLQKEKRKTTKAEGVGTTDSICGDLEDRQAAEGEMVDLLEFAAMNYQPNITSDKQVYWFEDDNETPILSEEIVERYLANFQPSEPAALKEFYCIGDKDNLFQCEEQCEDCKKGAALKEPQGSAPAVVITDGEERAIREIWNKYSGTTWVVPPDKFTAALKEFASLLTNHKS